MRWYLQPDGTLGRSAPEAPSGASEYIHDPEAGFRTTLPSGSIADIAPPWQFRAPAAGKAVVFESAPLADDLVMLGHGSVDLWFQSTSTDADIEVTLTEIRPDGQDMLVQGGWLRASHRALRDDATELRPIKTHLKEDSEPLPAGGGWVRAVRTPPPDCHCLSTWSGVR